MSLDTPTPPKEPPPRISPLSDVRLGEEVRSASKGPSTPSQSPTSGPGVTDRSKVTTNDTLIERGATHGNAYDQFAYAQELKALLSEGPNWDKLTPQQRETLDMVSTKLSRIMHGDHMHLDAWRDCWGYFELVAIMMQGKKV